MGFFNDIIARIHCYDWVYDTDSEIDYLITIFELGNIPLLRKTFEYYKDDFLSYKKGSEVFGFDFKARLGKIFILYLRFYKTYDSEVRESFAKSGFCFLTACLIYDAKDLQDIAYVALDLFLLIHYGGEVLLPVINDILKRASCRDMTTIEVEGNIFDIDDFNNGGDYLLREFSYFAATLASKIERKYPQIISSDVKIAFQKAKLDFEFAPIPVSKIIAKLQFIVKDIESSCLIDD